LIKNHEYIIQDFKFENYLLIRYLQTIKSISKVKSNNDFSPI